MGVNQRIPLRNLPEYSSGAPYMPQVANAANAPSVGRPSLGSPISSQINSFLAGSDAISPIVNFGTFSAIGGAGSGTVTTMFPNLPVLQNDGKTVQYAGTPGNQTYFFTAPQGMVLEYLVWGNILSINDVSASPGTTPIFATINTYGFATDDTGRDYTGSVNGVTLGKAFLPSGVRYRAFKVKFSVTAYAYAIPSAPANNISISARIFGQLILSYPSANPA